jgi:hypothetical protein
LLHAVAYGLLTRIEVHWAEVGATAGALAVRFLIATGNSAGPSLILCRNKSAVCHVNGEIVPFGDAVFAGADLFAGFPDFTMLIAEGAAAVDAEADRLSFA